MSGELIALVSVSGVLYLAVGFFVASIIQAAIQEARLFPPWWTVPCVYSALIAWPLFALPAILWVLAVRAFVSGDTTGKGEQ